MKIELLEEVASTNDYIKRYLADGEDTVVCARRQSGGKGTKGRSFLSCEGGVYLSALTFYQDLSAQNAFRIMAHAAVSVAATVGDFGVCANIKWPNDVLVGRKKICGILIENVVSDGKIEASIAGIGINVNNPLTGLEDIATSLYSETGVKFSVEEVRDRLIERYQNISTFEEYRSYLKFLGREVLVLQGDTGYRAIAKEVLGDGRLVVERRGERIALSAAEISLRL